MTGRIPTAPGTWGEVLISDTGNGVIARTRVRLMDGSYQDIRRRRHSWTAAREAVIDAAREVAKVHLSGALKPSSTFAALVEDWFAYEQQAGELCPQTLQEQYRQATSDLVPRLGKIAIRELTVPLCEQAYRDMLVPRRARDRSGSEYGEPREMIPAARNALGVMKKVLDRAVILGLRLDNPPRRCGRRSDPRRRFRRSTRPTSRRSGRR
ncbi:hypothetical protein [Curtobacterium sp. PsM8]|uniref:hypothetical protein n=1 Tax=Curtobacterium sp. PsM8 TaxID=3030532 RepID=UPI00263BE4C3|nr:hypothetical protein [Curtobacterium sp. PsM8]MDN4648141.1 hypothetical protein [Curtobacterium sp. PsM8]